MPVEQFTREQFEAALPMHKSTGDPLWESLGLVSGEYTYAVAVLDGTQPTNKRVVVRSSVN